MAQATRSSVLHRNADAIFQGVADDGAGRGADDLQTPEQKLWLAVIVQALRDARLILPSDCAGILLDASRPLRDDASGTDESIQGEARRWLVATFGDYAKDRQTICDLAGIDSESLRRVCQRRLDVLHGRVIEGPNVLSFDRRLSAMVAAMAEAA